MSESQQANDLKISILEAKETLFLCGEILKHPAKYLNRLIAASPWSNAKSGTSMSQVFGGLL
jgi:hypothetical protein